MEYKKVLPSIGQKPQQIINKQLKVLSTIGEKAFGPLIMALSGHPEANWKEAQSNYVNAFLEHLPQPEGVSVSDVDMGGVPGLLITPDEVIGERTLFYIHGGGYVSGSASMYVLLASRFAKELKAKVYLPDYRLAPEFPYPTPIDDTFTAYHWLIKSGCNSASLSIIGDSAGGAMVVTMMVKARNANLPLPASAVALSPWANLENNGTSMYNRDHLDFAVTQKVLSQMAHTFLDGILPTDADASPVFADVRGLSPTMILIGENEVMLSDAIRLASHLGENRVRVSLEIWPGLLHVWPQYGPELIESEKAIKNIAFFIEQFISE